MFFAPSRSRTSGSEGYEAQPGHRSSGLCVLPVVRETEPSLLTSDHLWPMATSIGINIGSQLHCKNSDSKKRFTYLGIYLPISNFKSKINEKHIRTYRSYICLTFDDTIGLAHFSRHRRPTLVPDRAGDPPRGLCPPRLGPGGTAAPLPSLHCRRLVHQCAKQDGYLSSKPMLKVNYLL